jgi:hypothetical protein
VPQLTDPQAASYTIRTYFGDWRPLGAFGLFGFDPATALMP